MNIVTAVVTIVHRLDGPVVLDILWAAAKPEYRIEHLSIQADPGCLYIGIYCLATTDQEAERAAQELLGSARKASPLLNRAVSNIRFHPESPEFRSIFRDNI